MPRRRIREYDIRRLLSEHLGRVSGLHIELPSVLVDSTTNLRRLKDPWLNSESIHLVCKPDVLALSRIRESGLVLFSASLEDVERFIDERVGHRAFVGGVQGLLSHFIVEPFVFHAPECEFDLSITSDRLANIISFEPHVISSSSTSSSVQIPVESDVNSTPIIEQLKAMVSRYVSPNGIKDMLDFITAVYKFFDDLDFTSLKFSPLCLLPSEPTTITTTEDTSSSSSSSSLLNNAGSDKKFSKVIPLDITGEIDFYAQFRSVNKWGQITFPLPWGHSTFQEESLVDKLSTVAQGGPTLRLTVVNPNGRIWMIAAGAGSAMIFGDTITHLGFGNELANFCEYSGNTTEDQTYQLCKTILTMLTNNCNVSGKPRGRSLMIGGCIANYTDVSVTFKGFIHAMREMKEALKLVSTRILVRRAGPNYHSALKGLLDCGRETGLDIKAFGPEISVTSVVAMAVQHIKSFPTSEPSTPQNTPLSTPLMITSSPGSPKTKAIQSSPLMISTTNTNSINQISSPPSPNPQQQQNLHHSGSPPLSPMFPPVPALLLDKGTKLTISTNNAVAVAARQLDLLSSPRSNKKLQQQQQAMASSQQQSQIPPSTTTPNPNQIPIPFFQLPPQNSLPPQKPSSK